MLMDKMSTTVGSNDGMSMSGHDGSCMVANSIFND